MCNQNNIPSIEQFQSSRLNVQVSCFANYKNVEHPKSVILWEWLLNNSHENEQKRIRLLENKRSRDLLKAQLPAITPSSLLHNRIKGTENLISLSGLMCIDIDKKDNTHLNNYVDLLKVIANIVNIIYAGESVSGSGYFALIPISDPSKLEYHFRAVEIMLDKYFNIRVDSSKGKNYKDLRGYSYTSKPYFNLDAETFTIMYIEPQRMMKTTFKPSQHDSNACFETLNLQLEKLVRNIEIHEIDITNNYDDWFRIGMSFASIGEVGRKYFHRVSNICPSYDYNENEKMFNRCLKTGNGSIRINSFFYFCKQFDIL
jgi:hypothetical protein